ncbi:MAG: DUF2220 family protein [Nitrospirota bacterium]|nr:DUF2220 family protein [Nitrospirota bacterium]
MISPEEIRRQAERWYKDVLAATVTGRAFFPKDVRFGKIKAAETLAGYSRIKRDISELAVNSRERLGYGYSIEFVRRKDRKTGEQRFPQRIFFPGEEDYLRFIGKDKEAAVFRRDSEKILAAFPQLREWVLANPLKIIEHAGRWPALLSVCAYFVDNPRPNLYFRELPLELPTKFVEEQKTILRQLLDVLIPDEVNGEESEFEKRFHLKYDEPLIRLMVLDRVLSRQCFSGLRDMSIPQSSFLSLSPECDSVLILENKTNFANIYNFLALPEIKKSIAVFGKGFQLGLLKNAAWLTEKRIFYWGDIDVHGFLLLSQLRSYFPHATSLMMDEETFEAFKHYRVTGADADFADLPRLTSEEHALFERLINLRSHNRLEQEKINHRFAVKKIRQALFANDRR